MTNERFKIFTDVQTNEETIVDMVKGEPLTINEICKELNKLTELIRLIAKSDSITPEDSVKEILRNEIRGIDTVTEHSAEAWNDYVILSNFFEEQYNEDWDNE